MTPLPLLRNLLLSISVCTIVSCTKDDSTLREVKSTDLSMIPSVTLSANARNKTAYFNKISSKSLVKIACEGTSLTYGQNEPGPALPINGAGQTRALYQYPSTLHEALTEISIKNAVVNRGFPGDRTLEGLSRWKDSTNADVVIIEYGTNDCYNFGGYKSGSVNIEAFTENLENIVDRRIKQGAWVILCSSPLINDSGEPLAPYRKACEAIAKKYDCTPFDIQSSVILNKADLYDGVHLTARTYQRWGNLIAPLLITK